MAMSEKLLWPEREGHLLLSKRGGEPLGTLAAAVSEGSPSGGPPTGADWEHFGS